MSSLRPVTFILLGPWRSTISRASRQFRLSPPSSSLRTTSISSTAHPSYFRYYSQETPPGKIYAFEDVKSFVEKPDPSRVLVDAREPGEIQATGTIPGSLNIPVTSKPDSFFITAEEFEDRFGFGRPEKHQEVIFYCRSGVRSRAAATFARQAGWSNVAEYQGSWLDWARNGGVKEGGKQA
ncbi:uncharacterized protein L3040_001841 [Drepanopeziza brunnea f. sp. 'multigermtubi']|uniref:Rhodanese domain containing protein n=1 Tax=Marssonina brunnea f. sp. multigermtubi (strain MB_m1) TaxID=1072389 RepID=K1WDH2_MARBU|nr:rhodanese domain containing protein [Drepanopeziza brunnea f. sp. 'multigermtubi' MB_m1]EKD15470.1 rhodanese domain containing protein [Drepanopeziza brunnea f. sp. 'multigermtubi' MB_m1]KAJ5052081.1 hypothetical protein L3040_001841 [Drepanopeziza brunnea f. sp. 'multigermtubi']